MSTATWEDARARELEAERATEAQVQALAREVAAGLGWPTVRERDGGGATIHGPGGQALLVHREWRDTTRLIITGTYPPGPTRGRAVHHEISAAMSRGAAAIARDVQRRLLPAYLPALAECVAAQAEAEAARAAREALAARLGGDPSSYRGSDTSLTVRVRSDDAGAGGGASAVIRIDYSGLTGRVDGSNLSAAQLAAIAAVVRGPR